MIEQINADIKKAMKNKEKAKLNALRFFKSKLLENKTSKKPLPPQDVLIAHHKKLTESMKVFPEHSDKKKELVREISFITPYMPSPLNETQVQEMIDQIVSEKDNPSMGLVMKALQEKIKGRFDGKEAAVLVKKTINR